MQQPDIYGPIVATLGDTLWWLIPLTLALALLKAFAPRLRGQLGEAGVAAALRRLFPEVRNDVILPDGRGGLTQIDHLALTPAGILAVETKTYRGTILGQAQEATWTQVLGHQRHSFQNPLRQNHAHVQALKALLPGVPVRGQVVFAGDARFPKGIPEGVCHLSALAGTLAALRAGSVSEELHTAWADILSQARTDRAAHQAHLAGLQARFGGVSGGAWRLVLPAVLLGVVGLWFHPPGGTPPRLQPSPAVLRPLFPGADHATLSRQASAPGPVATIEWARTGPVESASEACSLALAAVLIENTAEHRRARDRACGRRQASGQAGVTADRRPPGGRVPPDVAH